MTKEEIDIHFENKVNGWWSWTLGKDGFIDGIKQLMKDGTYDYLKFTKK